MRRRRRCSWPCPLYLPPRASAVEAIRTRARRFDPITVISAALNDARASIPDQDGGLEGSHRRGGHRRRSGATNQR